jgi:hypothetical protein
MNKIENVLKKLSALYEFNRKLKLYRLKSGAEQSRQKDAAKSRRSSRPFPSVP